MGYPNPFIQNIMVNYRLPKAGYVSVSVYNIKGQLVKRLVENRFNNGGNNIINWNAASFPNGTYIIRIISGNFSTSQRITLSR